MRMTKPFIFCAMLLLLPVGYGFAHIMDTQTGLEFEYKAELVEVAPVVDGFLDDPAWKEAKSGKLNQDFLEGRTWGESEDFKGTFAAVWRNGFLYIAIQLTDNQIETYHEKLSRQDHLVIYFDIDHTGHKSDLYQYIFPVGKNGSESDFPRIMVAWGNDGQSCELSVNLGYMPRKDDTIGFGILYNDVDGGRLNHRIGWGPVGETESDEFLADLVFAATIKPTENQKAVQWGRIKSLY